ncbi:MAG: hypothetical protein ACLGPL_12030, partial [Acidobacteriota bacterium]
IIFKPGYWSYPFSNGISEEYIKLDNTAWQHESVTIKLPKTTTRKDRRRNASLTDASITYINKSSIPYLSKSIHLEELRNSK